MTVYLHEGDLPDDLDLGSEVAIDSETMGLRFRRDPLCVVQLSSGDGNAHVVRMRRPDYDCPNLKRVLTDPAVTKIFHFGRFDIGMFLLHLGVETRPVYCTKIASKLARTYTDRHGLKDVVRETVGVDLSKAQQSSDWGAETLSPAQLDYAASDVLYLHAAKAKLDMMLAREGRTELAAKCFDFLPTRSALDLAGWDETDIFAHS
ncbi:3'-5' exonuclease [Brevundimonas sp. Leaf280]|jgi:ribonuclease D|uniref:ribonuclease D n=1 Tax=Brevundimonas sp. Leaf280 TaxID=1736320 RepID=UPI0006F28177|nr:ribonuclease D [Brevundimonas sp. Leaf280]KQP45875.1 3'-5' exonuclease [Brevundimonas sp. Leaf280]